MSRPTPVRLPRIEFEMRIPVSNWLISRGLSPICEVQCLGNCDLVGVRFEEKPVRLVELVAVELKLRKVAEVMRQCNHHQLCGVTEVWAAMLPEVAQRNAEGFAVQGIGLLSVGDSVEIIIPAARVDGCDLSPWKAAMRRRKNEHLWRMKNQNMLRYGVPA
jgi:hypothetical protein